MAKPVGKPRIRKIDAAFTIGVNGENASVSPSVTVARAVRFTTTTSPWRSGGLVALLNVALGSNASYVTDDSP